MWESDRCIVDHRKARDCEFFRQVSLPIVAVESWIGPQLVWGWFDTYKVRVVKTQVSQGWKEGVGSMTSSCIVTYHVTAILLQYESKITGAWKNRNVFAKVSINFRRDFVVCWEHRQRRKGTCWQKEYKLASTVWCEDGYSGEKCYKANSYYWSKLWKQFLPEGPVPHGSCHSRCWLTYKNIFAWICQKF